MYARTASPRRTAEVVINRSVFRYVFWAGLDVTARTGFKMRSFMMLVSEKNTGAMNVYYHCHINCEANASASLCRASGSGARCREEALKT